MIEFATLLHLTLLHDLNRFDSIVSPLRGVRFLPAKGLVFQTAGNWRAPLLESDRSFANLTRKID